MKFAIAVLWGIALFGRAAAGNSLPPILSLNGCHGEEAIRRVWEVAQSRLLSVSFTQYYNGESNHNLGLENLAKSNVFVDVQGPIEGSSSSDGVTLSYRFEMADGTEK